MGDSKQGLSDIFCRKGGGIYFPMIVYKAQNLHPEWTEGGLPGALYDTTSSGWFDVTIFDYCFLKLFLPFTLILDGVKAIIGDNLGKRHKFSHWDQY